MNMGARAWRWARLWMTACAVVVASGCAQQHHATVTDAKDVGVGQGVVLLSVTSNAPRAGQFDQIVLEPESPDASFRHTYRMAQLAQGLSRDTALFVGALPEGRYRVTRFEVGNQFIDINEGMRARIGTVVVTAGKTRDLGRLIVTGLNERVLIGRSELVKSNVELIRRYAPEVARHAANVEGTGWASPRQANDKVEELALATPVGADSIIELPAGEVVAVSRMGSILVRTTDAKWRRIGIDGLESLLSITAVDEPDTRLVAVGEFGTIVRVGSNWKPQRVATGNLPAGNLLHVSGNSRVGWLVAQSEGSRVVIYRSERLEGGDWRAIRTTELGRSIWTGQARFWAWPTAQGMGYAVSSGEIQQYNSQTQAWTKTAAPQERSIQSIHADPGGVLSMVSPGGILAHLFVSRDHGALWEELQSPVKVNAYAPVRLPSGAIVLQGNAFTGRDLYVQQAINTEWTLLKDTVYLQESLTATPTKGLFAVDDGRGPSGFASIRHSTDEGRTWKLEYSNYINTGK